MHTESPLYGKLISVVLRWLDVFLPEGVHEPIVRMRMRLLVAGSMALSLAAIVFAYQAAALQGGVGWISVALWSGALVALCFPAILKVRGSAVAAGTLLCLEFSLLIGVVALAGNGADGPALIWAPAVPLLAAILVGRRTAVVMAGVVVSELLALHWLETSGVLIVEAFSAEQVSRVRIMALCSATVLAAFLGWLYESQTLAHLRRAAQRTRILHMIGRSVLAATSAEEIAVEVLKRLKYLLPGTQAAVLQFDGDRAVVLATAIGGVTDRGRSYAVPMEGLEAVLDQGEILFGVVSGDGSVNIPLKAGDQEVGLLHLSASSPQVYTTDEVGIAREVADMLAVALQQEVFKRRLVEAKERAERSERLQSELLTNMSHEIRTPLAGIMGIASVIQEEVGPELGEMAGMIESSGERLFRTLDSVMYLAQIESETLETVTSDFNIVHTAREVAGKYRRAAAEKGLTIEVECTSGSGVLAHGDPHLAGRCLGCIVDNAVKFTEEGGVRILINKTPHGVTVRVHDTGIGMSSRFATQAFDAFRQESTGPSRTHEGSGLGLTVAQKIAQILGGDITVDTDLELGSTFALTLPAGSTASIGSSAIRRSAASPS